MKVRLAVIGLGNRAGKYLEYVKRNPNKVVLVAVSEPIKLRLNKVAKEFNLCNENCFADYKDLFRSSINIDAVLITTPENEHYNPCVLAISRGCNILVEKPIAQSLKECEEIVSLAEKKGVVAGVCHVLRYHPYFEKIKEIISSKELGEVISITHECRVGIDRMTHGFVRGMWSRKDIMNPFILSKCCHDMDYLLYISGSKCESAFSVGGLNWFKAENAPKGAAKRCIDCSVEQECPYSAIDLYCRRRQWISNFDVPEGLSIEQVLEEQMKVGDYGRCVYYCNNNVFDNQSVIMKLGNGVKVTLVANCFTLDDRRITNISLSNGEIWGNEDQIIIRNFTTKNEQVLDFSHISNQPFHAGADLALVDDFIDCINNKGKEFKCALNGAIEGS
jgi:Predicted dehydrogenases and related proteins